MLTMLLIHTYAHELTFSYDFLKTKRQKQQQHTIFVSYNGNRMYRYVGIRLNTPALDPSAFSAGSLVLPRIMVALLHLLYCVVIRIQWKSKVLFLHWCCRYMESRNFKKTRKRTGKKHYQPLYIKNRRQQMDVLDESFTVGYHCSREGAEEENR